MPTRDVNLPDAFEKVVRINMGGRREDDTKRADLRAAIDAGDSSGFARGDVFASVRKSLGTPSLHAEPVGLREIGALARMLHRAVPESCAKTAPFPGGWLPVDPG